MNGRGALMTKIRDLKEKKVMAKKNEGLVMKTVYINTTFGLAMLIVAGYAAYVLGSASLSVQLLGDEFNWINRFTGYMLVTFAGGVILVWRGGRQLGAAEPDKSAAPFITDR